MKDAKEQVWEGFRGELRRRRVRRRAAGSAVVLGGLAVAVWWMVAPQPASAPPAMAQIEPPALSEIPQAPPQLAVYVHDAEGMRLELIDAGAMTTAALSMSLEPVVWSGESW
jgi:hypothetical protein